MKPLLSYHCRGQYKGRPCGRTLCKSDAGHVLEVKCPRCKAVTRYEADGTAAVLQPEDAGNAPLSN